MKKKVRYVAICVITVILVVIYIGFHHIAPYAMIKPPRVSISETPNDFNLVSESFAVKVDDSLNLSAYWIKTDKISPKGVVILVHGIGGCKEHFLSTSALLAKNGIESILVDLRAHGKSGGIYTTYGFKEKKDIFKLVNVVKEKSPNLSIGIWGNSLGGAIAIQALEYDERINFGVIESTFTDLSQIVYDYKKRYLKGFGIRFLSDYALDRAGKIGDFNPESVRPLQSVKHIGQPVLIAHGNADQSIGFKYGKALYANLKTTEKEFIEVENGGHYNLYEMGGEAYKNRILNFILKNVDR
ncbi:MAG: alpha/beta fold hydrolase [Bacteroidota bacterium]